VTSTAPNRVRVVVDSNFGERLAGLPAHEPVWIIDSPANTPVAHRLWKQRPAKNHLTGITTFKPGPNLSAQEELLNQLGTIDLHHGEYSANPPYTVIEVIGCTPSDKIRAALAELGFTVDSARSSGFTAVHE
jgi:hypothetical protein